MQNELFQYCPDMILFRRRYGRIVKKVIIALICLQVLYYLNLPLPGELYLNAKGRGRRSYQNTFALLKYHREKMIIISLFAILLCRPLDGGLTSSFLIDRIQKPG